MWRHNHSALFSHCLMFLKREVILCRDSCDFTRFFPAARCVDGAGHSVAFHISSVRSRSVVVHRFLFIPFLDAVLCGDRTPLRTGKFTHALPPTIIITTLAWLTDQTRLPSVWSVYDDCQCRIAAHSCVCVSSSPSSPALSMLVSSSNIFVNIQFPCHASVTVTVRA